MQLAAHTPPLRLLSRSARLPAGALARLAARLLHVTPAPARRQAAAGPLLRSMTTGSPTLPAPPAAAASTGGPAPEAATPAGPASTSAGLSPPLLSVAPM